MTPQKKAWYEANKERIIKRVLTTRMKRLYGITPVDYAQMLVQQGYRCAICGMEDWANLHGKLYPDHDHSTGKIRGLLCHQCNIALGAAGDNVSRLKAMIEYLEGTDGL